MNPPNPPKKLPFLTRVAARCPRPEPAAEQGPEGAGTLPRHEQIHLPQLGNLQNPLLKVGPKNKAITGQESNFSFKQSVAITFQQFHSPSANFLVLITAVSSQC